MRPAALRYRQPHPRSHMAMPPKGVDQPAREAMTTKIAQRLTTMLAGQNMIEAARQIEAKCYDSAKDATDYKRKVEKRLAKAAKALEASQRPSMSEPSDTATLEKKQALARKRSREDAAPEWLDLLRAARDSDSARDLLREHGATLEWWRGAPAVIGRRLRAIIDAATQAGSVGDEVRTWASGALQKVEKLEKAATSLLKPLEARSGNLAELPGYCTKLKESKAELESKLDKLAPLLGWRDVPAPVQLVVCGYLDLKALGRLEICGRNLDAVRAWNTKVAGLARGTLGDLSTKQFLRAQTRARALLPPSLGGKSPFQFGTHWRPVSFDDFAFTIAVTWIEPGKPERSFAESPFMRLRTHSELGDVNLSCGVFTFFPTAGPGHEAFSACLRRVSQEMAVEGNGAGADFPGRVLEQLEPKAYLTCTRRRDGAATRVGLFSSIGAVNEHVADEETEGSLYFGEGKLLLTPIGAHTSEVHEVPALEITLTIIWDASSGRVRGFGCWLYVNGEDQGEELPEETFLALLRARLDESVRA